MILRILITAFGIVFLTVFSFLAGGALGGAVGYQWKKPDQNKLDVYKALICSHMEPGWSGDISGSDGTSAKLECPFNATKVAL